MKYTKLGNSDLNVSRICMGCMGFGDSARGQHSWTIDEEHTREIIKRGLDLGVNFYDTAIAYQSGTSEQYLGRALRDFAKRDEVVVATKFLPRTPDEIEKGISGQQHIENMLNTSLSNLGMDYVDLYIYHMWDWQTPIEDIMDGLNRIVKAGKARYIGISNCFAWQLAKANAFAEKEGFAKFVSVQGHYNLIFREEERDFLGEYGRGGDHNSKLRIALRCRARFFTKLSFCRFQRVLILRIELACGNFKKDPSVRISELSFHNNSSVIEQGKHRDCSRVKTYLAHCFLTVWQKHLVAYEIYYVSRVNIFSFQLFFFKI